MDDRLVDGLEAGEINHHDATEVDGAPSPSADTTLAACRRELAALKAELAASEARWSALHQVAIHLTQQMYSGDILKEIVHHGMDLLRADYGVLTELESLPPNAPAGAEPMLIIRVALNRDGPPPVRVGTRLMPGEGLTGLAIQTGQIQIVDAYHRWSQRVKVLLPGIQAAIAAPLFGRHGPIGALGIAVRQEKRRFSDADIQTITLFAQQAAAVLEAIAGRQAERELLIQAERKRLAQELHDGFQQHAAALLLKIDHCEATLDATQADVRAGLEEIAVGLQALMRDARAAIYALYGSRSDKGRLEDALRALIESLAADTGLSIRLEMTSLPRGLLTWQGEQAILRFVREALTNVQKHARATEVAVSLKYPVEGRVRLSVSDNGQGARPDEVWHNRHAHGFGLLSLREQIEALGGRFGLDSAPQAGLAVWAEIPTAEVTGGDSRAYRGRSSAVSRWPARSAGAAAGLHPGR